MKGVDALIASVLIIIISITAIFIALQLGNPSTEKAKEVLLMQEGKNNLITIDNSIKNVLAEGEGSTRALRLAISGGYYTIDNVTNSILFSMESRAQIVGEGVSKIEDGINITGTTRMVYLSLNYSNIQVAGKGEIGRGTRTITVRNDGYNSTSQKQIIYISPTP
jgi:hypothetical protein